MNLITDKRLNGRAAHISSCSELPGVRSQDEAHIEAIPVLQPSMLVYQGWGLNSSHCNVLNALKNLRIVLEVLVRVLISCYLLNQLGRDVVVDVSHGLRGSCTDKDACEGPEEPGEHGREPALWLGPLPR